MNFAETTRENEQVEVSPDKVLPDKVLPGKPRASVRAIVFMFVATFVPLCGCGPSIPTGAVSEAGKPTIWPDYSDVVIPPNIAPMNFRIDVPGERYATRIVCDSGASRIVRGRTVSIPARFWKKALRDNRGRRIAFEIYAYSGGKWHQYDSIANTVSPDPIDPYLAYRLIPPGQYFGELTLNQRCLETFSERQFFDNNATFNENPKENGTCANCHCFRNGGTDQFMFHVRFMHSGTILVQGDTIKKIETRFGETGNSATYPAWHPTLPVIVFSANETLQYIHSRSLKKNETFDTYSDLLLYDIEKNAFTTLFKTRNVFETFPCWSPDGLTLYYCVCDTLPPEKVDMFLDSNHEGRYTPEDFESFKYNLWKMSFDPKTYRFGKPELVIDAENEDGSVAFPRVSPDGRFIVYTLADFGTFPIMHRESDLWLYEIATGRKRRMSEIDSDMPETYHSWSSNGRWLVFSSRRDDGSYTRLYIAHVDGNGVGSRPFLLPQKDPEDNMRRMKSYNIPEFVTQPIRVSTGRIMRKIESGKALPADYD